MCCRILPNFGYPGWVAAAMAGWFLNCRILQNFGYSGLGEMDWVSSRCWVSSAGWFLNGRILANFGYPGFGSAG